MERAAIRARARARTFAWHVHAGAYSGAVPQPLNFSRQAHSRRCEYLNLCRRYSNSQ